MEVNQKEKGYALITVLITATVFMVLFIAFMGQAFNSVKQNKVVENQSQSVAVAEAGISYYQVLIQQIYENYRTKYDDVVAENNFKTITHKDIAIFMASKISNELKVKKDPIKLEGSNDEAYFNIVNNAADDIKVIPDDTKVTINFSVEGFEKKKGTILKAKMTIDLSSINIKGNPDGHISDDPAIASNIKWKDNNSPVGCNSLDCKELYSPTTVNVIQQDNKTNRDLSGKTIYSKDGLNIQANVNGSSNELARLHADKYLVFDGNMNSASYVLFETKGKATINGNLTGNHFYIVIEQDLTSAKQFTLQNYSFAFIGGNANTEKLTIESNSKMCVKGTVSVPKNQLSINTGGELIILKKSGTPIITGEDTRKYEVGQEEFDARCRMPVLPGEIVWGDGVDTDIADVDYTN